MPDTLSNRLARYYGLPLQVSSFFSLLILSECTTPQSAFKNMGAVDARGLVFKLRTVLRVKAPEIEIRSQRSLGYWLDADIRCALARKFGVELGIATGMPSSTPNL